MDDRQRYNARLQQARSDITRLNSDITAFERTQDPLDVRSATEERMRLARVMASNSAAVMSLAQLNKEGSSARSSLSSSGSFKPCPPPRRDSSISESPLGRRREPTSPRAPPPTDHARSAPSLPLIPRRTAPSGSALSAIRARAVSAAAKDHAPWEVPSPQKVTVEPATVSIRVRGKDGKVQPLTRLFRPTDTVQSVLHEYLRQCLHQQGADLTTIQVFVPLMPPIPYPVMGKVTLAEAKMVPSCTVIVQM